MRTSNEQPANRSEGSTREIALDETGEQVWHVTTSTDVEAVPLSLTRRAIADRLSDVAAIPAVTTFRTVDCTALEAVRADLDVSPLPIVVRALAEVCRDHPMLNAAWDGERILIFHEVRVGDRDRHTSRFGGSGDPRRRFARDRRRSRPRSHVSPRLLARTRLTRDDTVGPTIAVTNTGSYGSEFGTPLLNPGHAVTIALGVIEPRALVIDGSSRLDRRARSPSRSTTGCSTARPWGGRSARWSSSSSRASAWTPSRADRPISSGS